jgi:hypothetical protein
MGTAKIPKHLAPQRIALQRVATQQVHRGAMGFRWKSMPWSRCGVSIFLFRFKGTVTLKEKKDWQVP